MGDNDFLRVISGACCYYHPLLVLVHYLLSYVAIYVCYCMLFDTLAPVRCTRQTVFCLTFCLFIFCLSILFLMVCFCFSAGNMVIWPPVVPTKVAIARSDWITITSLKEVSEIVLDCHCKGSEFPLVEPCVKGRLANAFEFWAKDLEAPPFVIDIIRQGYSLPFSGFPPRCFLSNNRSALRNPQFLESAILEFLEKQLINEHRFPPHCVNPLTVAEGKKLRLVLGLREVNKYVVKPKFRYEDLRSLSEVFEQGFWFFTWDLK